MFCYLVVTYEKIYNNKWELCNSYIHANNIKEVIDNWFNQKDCLIINIIRFSDDIVG